MAKDKYTTHVQPKLEQVAEWTKQGAGKKEIAEKLGVSYSAFRRYCDLGDEGDARYMALSSAIRAAAEKPDGEVEAALYRKCIGYNAKVKKHYKLKRIEHDPVTGRKVSEREELVEAEDEVHVPADTAAQMFYLANRCPEKWRYKPESIQGPEEDDTGVVILSEVQEAGKDG